jgi:hypothetical protein
MVDWYCRLCAGYFVPDDLETDVLVVSVVVSVYVIVDNRITWQKRFAV